MSDGQSRAASGTARSVAYLRAAHMVIDGKPPILDDSVIERLLGADARALILSRADHLQAPNMRGLRSHVVLRSRVAEDALADDAARGSRQYVILGAGLDTFAWRQPAWAAGLSVIEVDHPASQAEKQAMLAGAGLQIPKNLRFAAIDFESETLGQGLVRNGVDISKQASFSWLGVTMYLTRDAIDQVLETTAAFPPGSTITLTFAQPRADDEFGAWLAGRAAEAGEPWLSYFTPEEMEQTLRRAGYARIDFLGRDEATRRYYEGRSDGLVAPRRVSIVTATV